jgi:hypothetical protein
MQSKSEGTLVELKTSGDFAHRTSAMKLYEVYSRCSIMEIIRERTVRYDKADEDTKKKMEKDVNVEVEGFCIWLEETKGLNPLSAHGYAASLKSLLLGLPIGVSVAELFSFILDGSQATVE